MKKNSLIIFLSAIMAVSLLSGCGRSASVPGQTAKTEMDALKDDQIFADDAVLRAESANTDDGLIYVREYQEGPKRSYKSRSKWLESRLETGNARSKEQAGDGQSLEEWVNDDMLQSIISSMSNSEIKIYVEAIDAKTISFQFQFKEQLSVGNSRDRATLRDMFDDLIDAQESVFNDMRDSIVEDTGIENLVLRIEYLNADGSTLYSRDFTG